MKSLLFATFALFFTVSVFAHANYTGYSGAPGRQTCASSCHGSGSGTVVAVGFPSTYIPGQQYTITLRHSSGSSINNFNASCRVGTGSTNAGTIAAGLNSTTYNTSGETNGVHLSANNRDSCKFVWTAPAAGTGAVRLYVGAHQGSSASGVNTGIAVTAQEGAATPDPAYNPDPADTVICQGPSVSLNWLAGARALTHNIYFGTDNNPPFIRNQVGTTYVPTGADLQANTLYYWRVDEVNGVGTTTGPLWSFRTCRLPQLPINPIPADSALNIGAASTLSWTSDADIANHDLFVGTISTPTLIWDHLVHDPVYQPTTPFLPNTRYYWRVVERNSWGEAHGPLWTFVTGNEPVLPEQATMPSPADSAQFLTNNVTLTWQPGARATSHDLYFGSILEPSFVGTQTGTSYVVPGAALQAGQTYFWRIDERNTSGVTTGPVWRFSTWPQVTNPSGPQPENGATNVPVSNNIYWLAGNGTQSHDLLLDLVNPPQHVIWSQHVGDPLYDPGVNLLNDTVYYWQVIEHNPFGQAAGPVWSFRTELGSGAREPNSLVREFSLGPVYPNPFNAKVSIPFALTRASDIHLSLVDVMGRTVAHLAQGNFAAGEHTIVWSAQNDGTGIYFVRLTSAEGTRTLKVVALK